MRNVPGRSVRALLAGAAVLVLLAAGPTHAAVTRTLVFEAANPTVLSGDPFGQLGLSQAPATVTGSVTFQVTPRAPAVTNGSGIFEAETALFDILSFTVSLDGITLTGGASADNPNSNYLQVQDGVGARVPDQLRILAGDNPDVRADLELDQINLVVRSGDDVNVFDGADTVPSLATLNDLTELTLLNIFLVEPPAPLNPVSTQHSVQYTSVTFVPEPTAAGAMLLTALALVASRPRRRDRTRHRPVARW